MVTNVHPTTNYVLVPQLDLEHGTIALSKNSARWGIIRFSPQPHRNVGWISVKQNSNISIWKLVSGESLGICVLNGSCYQRYPLHRPKIVFVPKNNKLFPCCKEFPSNWWSVKNYHLKSAFFWWETAIRDRCGGARTNRRCGGIDTRKLHGRSQQQGGGRRRIQDPLRGDHLRWGPPIPRGPVEAREQASENDGISRQPESERPSRDAGGDTSTNKICRGSPMMSPSKLIQLWYKQFPLD